MTVTGTIFPSSRKMCVMPTFVPKIPGSIPSPWRHPRTSPQAYGDATDWFRLSFICLPAVGFLPLPVSLRVSSARAGSLRGSRLTPQPENYTPCEARLGALGARASRPASRLAAVPAAEPIGACDNLGRMQGPTSRYSRGYLPHIEAGSVRQFITWRLNDAVKVELIREWREELSQLPEEEFKRQ